MQQYLRDTQVRKHFIYETLRPPKARKRLDGTAAAAKEFCLLAVRSPMQEDEEHNFARQSSATFLKEAGVGILWLQLSEHVQLDIPTRTSWDEASPHLEQCIVEHVRALYRVQVATTGGQGHSGRRTKRVLASLTRRLVYYPWERNVAGACHGCNRCADIFT